MSSKAFTFSVILGFIGILAGISAEYLANPYWFYFRAWEFTENTNYKGVDLGKTTFHEAGDSSRQYLLQRYFAETTVTLNQYGNRKQFSEQPGVPQVLFVGDSQLWGSGESDSDNIPWILSEKTGVPIYNASRRHGLEFLKNPLYKFKAIVFSSTERDPMANLCKNMELSNLLEKYPTDQPFLLPAPSFFRYGFRTARYLNDFLRATIEKIYHVPTLGFTAPAERLFSHRPFGKDQAYLERDLECSYELHDFFAKAGIETAFFFYPSNQTLYGGPGDVEGDEITRNYIDIYTKNLAQRGIKTFNAKTCLLAAKGESLSQMHDTHLNGNGQRALAKCLIESNIRTIF